MTKRVMKTFTGEEEELLRKFLFTNPHGNDSFVYPQSLVAGEELSPLMSAYSRTHVPFQDRTLQFLDQHKQEQTRAMLPYIPQIILASRNGDGSLKLSTKTAMFNAEWVLLHGHSSIKEETPLFGCSEEISDITVKRISGHPLNKPQVKSTRYLSFKGALDLALGDDDIRSLHGADKFLAHVDYMNGRYIGMTEKLTDLVFRHVDTSKVVEYLRREENVSSEVEKRLQNRRRVNPAFELNEIAYREERQRVLDELSEESVRKDIGKFVLDSSRVYLLAATRTSIGYSVDARTLEEIITDMISSPREEDRKRGQSIWNEAKKISPTLLGERSHVRVDEWKMHNETELRRYLQQRFADLGNLAYGRNGVNLLHSSDIDMNSDAFNAALVAFPYLDASLAEIYDNINEGDAEDILERAHVKRSEFDTIHPAISHGGIMVEFAMPYHGYRDIFRHRRGSRSTQLLTTRLGFTLPKIFDSFDLTEEVMRDMEKSAELYEEARKLSPHVAEKLVPFGANCRSLYSWSPSQISYVTRLRGDIAKGNESYVDVARELARQVGEIMPQTARFFRVDSREYPPHLWKRGYGWYDAEGRNAA